MLERSLPCLLNTLPLRWWGVMATLALYILGEGFSHYVEIILPKRSITVCDSTWLLNAQGA